MLRVPVWSLLLIGSAALAVSIAQLPHNAWVIAGLLVVGVLLVGAFVVVDRRSHAAVLPPSVFGSGPLRWIYLTMAVLMMAVMVDTYVPLFGQRLGHLSPVAAGFLGASLAIGWTVSEIVSASLNSRRVIGFVVLVAPLLMAAGLALGAVTQRDDASFGLVVVWALALLVAGTGIGMAWPHLSVRAMDSRRRPGRERRGGRGDQHRAIDLRGLRRRAGRGGGQHGDRRGTGRGPLALRGVHRVGRDRRRRFAAGDVPRPQSRAVTLSHRQPVTALT